VLVSAGVLIAITGMVLRYRRGAPYLMAGWFWYLGTLVPVIGLVQIGSQAMADRYTYLPAIGLFLAVSWGVKSVVERRPELKKKVIVFSLILLSGLLILARAQVDTWQNSLTLFEHALAVTEDNPVAHNSVGAAYVAGEGSCQKAIPHYLKAIELSKGFAEAYYNLGVCAVREGNGETAISYFRKALEVNPLFVKAMINLGLMMMQSGKLDEARAEFQQLLQVDPFHEAAHVNLGTVFIHQGKLGDAARHLGEALRINPGNAEAHNSIGVVFLREGRLEEASAHFRKALALDPGHRYAERNLQIVLVNTKK
jgi:protein O-mannosyl-transferase